MLSEHPIILITGANGFIGSRLCRKFAEHNYKIIAGVRRSADLRLLNEIPFDCRYGDVTLPDTLPDMVRDVDLIIHNAGVVKGKTESDFFAVNEAGTRNLFEAIREHNPSIQKVIYLSSLAVAGPSVNGKAVKESDPPNPITAYGRSKQAGEQVALSFASDFPVVSIRPTGVYGPGDKEIFTLFKTVYSRLRPSIGNSNRRMQLVHVDDLSRGVFNAITTDTKSGSIYFIAENQSYPMRELMALLGAACSRRGLPIAIPAPLFRVIAGIAEFTVRLIGGTPMLTREKSKEILASWEVDTSAAKNELGFESAISFEDGARQTFKWYIDKGWL